MHNKRREEHTGNRRQTGESRDSKLTMDSMPAGHGKHTYKGEEAGEDGAAS